MLKLALFTSHCNGPGALGQFTVVVHLGVEGPEAAGNLSSKAVVGDWE